MVFRGSRRPGVPGSSPKGYALLLDGEGRMTTLSERMRYTAMTNEVGDYCIFDGDTAMIPDLVVARLERLHVIETKENSPTDILKHNYEKLGLSSALVVNKKHGRRSAFGYMGREW